MSAAREELDCVERYLEVLTDLTTPSSDLHVVSRDALAVVLDDLRLRMQAALVLLEGEQK